MSRKHQLRVAIADACHGLHSLVHVKETAMVDRLSYRETSESALAALPEAKRQASRLMMALTATLWNLGVDTSEAFGKDGLDWFARRVTEASRSELEAWASAIADAEPDIIAALDDAIADTERPVAAEGVA